MRASGVRSSWLQLASSRRWAATSSSMRWAERLKLCGQGRHLVAALDLDARAEIAAANCSTPAFSRSSRRPRPRTTG